MNIYNDILDKIKALVEDVAKENSWANADTSRINAEPPKDISHGDIATNAAMILAAQTKQKPRDIADALVAKINQFPEVAKTEIAGPGFINITLHQSSWGEIIPVILNQRLGFGSSKMGEHKRVNIEYVSANPTGPMHVGHGRGAVFGDALANLLLKAGYTVTKEYYINDGGGQIEKLADSVFLRYREACGEDIGEIPEGFYPGDYLVPVGQALQQIHGDALRNMPREAWLPIVRDFAVDAMMSLIKADLAELGIYHDVFTSERALTESGATEEALNMLEAKGLIYHGVLEAPKGKAPEDWEPRPQTLFKSSEFGDDADRAVKKSDGSYAYLAPDMALHYDKIKRGFTHLIDVFGADHGGYVKRISAVVAALSEKKVTIDVKLCQMVKLTRGGEPVKMSKRAGTFITVREVVDEVGKDVFRFIMLTRKNDAQLDFDFDLVKEQTRENPVFYVQYAHARCMSVLRHAASDMAEAFHLAKSADASVLKRLKSPEELALIRQMANWPRIVESAAAAAEPHRIAFYLADLAGSFHALWNKGNDDLTLRFLQKDDIEVTAARLAMIEACALTIASGLTVLGVEPIQELR